MRGSIDSKPHRAFPVSRSRRAVVFTRSRVPSRLVASTWPDNSLSADIGELSLVQIDQRRLTIGFYVDGHSRLVALERRHGVVRDLL